MAITSQPQRAAYPLTLDIARAGLSKPSWVKISQVRTLAVERIGEYAGRVGPEDLARIIDGLNEIIG
jgi:mRNA interferase MazF